MSANARAYAARLGRRSKSLSSSSPSRLDGRSGTSRFSTSSVMATAMTPSLKATIRPKPVASLAVLELPDKDCALHRDQETGRAGWTDRRGARPTGALLCRRSVQQRGGGPAPAADRSLHERRELAPGMLTRERERADRPLECGGDLRRRRGGIGGPDPGIVRPRREERALGLKFEVVAQTLDRREPALVARRGHLEPCQRGGRAGEGAHHGLWLFAVAGCGPRPVALGHGHNGARRRRAPQRDEQLGGLAVADRGDRICQPIG